MQTSIILAPARPSGPFPAHAIYTTLLLLSQVGASTPILQMGPEGSEKGHALSKVTQ